MTLAASFKTMTEVLPETVKQRPAEVSGAAGAVTLLIVRVLGVTDADTIVALGIVVGFVPAAVTWAVALFHRRPPTPPTTLAK